MDKPYAFCDWVNEARATIADRGETPVLLIAEPGGSEFSYPENTIKNSRNFLEHLVPGGKLNRDTHSLIHIESTVDPSTKGNAPGAWVHLRFRPSSIQKVH